MIMDNQKRLISVVIPCFNEEENIPNTYRVVKGITDQIGKYDFEVIFVDNGSSDRSSELMSDVARTNPNVTAVLLSRNFGPESSGLAGLSHARGDAIILMAADLQDPPSLIPGFIKKWEEGYDMVLGQIISTQDSRLMLWMRRKFYQTLRKVSYVDIPLNVSGFGLIDKKVNQAIIAMPERSRFYRGLLALAGFKQAFVPFKRPERQFGKTSYNFMRYVKHAEKGLFGFTTLPLDLISYLAIGLVLLSILGSLIYVIWVLAFGNPIKGSMTLLLAITFFGGVQLFATSILGKYIGIIFEETKQRPNYIVKDVVSQSTHGSNNS